MKCTIKLLLVALLLCLPAHGAPVEGGGATAWTAPTNQFGGSGSTSVLHFRATHLTGFNAVADFCMATDMDSISTGFVDCSAAGNIGSTVDHAGYSLDGTVTLHRFVCSVGIIGTWDAADQLTLQFGTVNVGTAAFTAAAGTDFQLGGSGVGGADVTVTAADFGFVIDLGDTDVTVTGAATPPTILSLRVTSGTDPNSSADFVGNCSLEHTYVPNG